MFKKNLIAAAAAVFLALSFMPAPVSSAGEESTGEENLIQNASFEEGSGNIPSSWSTWAWKTESNVTEFKVEDGDAHTGSRFVTIINKKENDARYRQTVSVSENTIYRLSCWIRTENAGSGKTGANLSIEGRIVPSRDFKGTNNNWQYTELYVRTGEGINSFTLTVGLGGYGNINKGKASFDDVSVVKADEIPQGAAFAQLDPIEQNNQQNQTSDKGTSSDNTGKPLWILLVAIAAIAAVSLYYVFTSGKVKNNEGEHPDEAEDIGEDENEGEGKGKGKGKGEDVDEDMDADDGEDVDVNEDDNSDENNDGER
jgi:hypothetical protein